MHVTEVTEIVYYNQTCTLVPHACCTNLLVTCGTSNSLLHGLPDSRLAVALLRLTVYSLCLSHALLR